MSRNRKILSSILYFVLIAFHFIFSTAQLISQEKPEKKETKEAKPGIYVSKDNGKNWKFVCDKIAAKIFFCAKDEKKMFLQLGSHRQTKPNFCVSKDAGKTWTNVKVAGGGWVNDLVVDSKNSKLMLASTFRFGLQKTSDGGKTWEKVSNNRLKYMQISPDNGHIFALQSGMGCIIVKSEDNGKTWKNVKQIQSYGSSLTVDFKNKRIAILVDNFGFMISNDMGKTWKSYKKGLEGANVASSFLVLHPKKKDVMFAYIGVSWGRGSFKPGVYKSIDGGKSWKIVKEGLAGSAYIVPKSGNVLLSTKGGFLVCKGKAEKKKNKKEKETDKKKDEDKLNWSKDYGKGLPKDSILQFITADIKVKNIYACAIKVTRRHR